MFDGWRLASSTSAGSPSTDPTGRSSAEAVRSRHAASSRATARARGSSCPTRGRRSQAVSGSRSSLADSSRRHSSRAQLEPAGLLEAALNLVGELEQVGDVLGGVAQLLGGQRPGVPPRVARGLADPAAEHRPEQVAVPGLRARANEPGRELRVEDVRDLGRPGPAEDRDVLAAGVEHDLDRRVGEQVRDRARVDPALERVDQRDVRSGAVGGFVVDRDLDQAQQRPVAALGHELGVDPDPSVRARDGRRRRHFLGARERLGGFAAGGLGAHPG